MIQPGSIKEKVLQFVRNAGGNAERRAIFRASIAEDTAVNAALSSLDCDGYLKRDSLVYTLAAKGYVALDGMPGKRGKLCTKCEDTKAPCEFPKSSNVCRECLAAKARDRYAAEKQAATEAPPIAASDVSTSPTKTCRTCQQVKPLEAFGKNKVMADGLFSSCRPCVSGAARARALKVHERRRERAKFAELAAKHAKAKEIAAEAETISAGTAPEIQLAAVCDETAAAAYMRKHIEAKNAAPLLTVEVDAKPLKFPERPKEFSLPSIPGVNAREVNGRVHISQGDYATAPIKLTVERAKELGEWLVGLDGEERA